MSPWNGLERYLVSMAWILYGMAFNEFASWYVGRAPSSYWPALILGGLMVIAWVGVWAVERRTMRARMREIARQ